MSTYTGSYQRLVFGLPSVGRNQSVNVLDPEWKRRCQMELEVLNYACHGNALFDHLESRCNLKGSLRSL